MQTPNALTTLWEAVFGSGGQDGLSQRVAAVEAETESNAGRLDRINSKMDKLMFLILSTGASMVAGLLYLIVQG